MMIPHVLGLDFGTTNSVAAVADGLGARLVQLDTPDGADAVFRSALCFWQDGDEPGGLGIAAGPWAIAEYLDYPEGSRFLQSFKTVAANTAFEFASVFNKRYRFEELGQLFLSRMAARAGGALGGGAARVVVGRPVTFAGSRPDEALARRRYAAMFAGLGAEVHYVYEPLGAAYSYAARVAEPVTVLVADIGGGTSDFSVVRIAGPGATRRCVPLAHAGVGIAGDRFDQRIVERLVLPMLGKGGLYRSFDKVLDIPGGWFADVADWSRLALMRNRKTLAELETLRRAALDPAAIGRLIAVIEGELGYALYDAVGGLKRTLSEADRTVFLFDGGSLRIDAEVTRADFEDWIAPDVARIEAAVDRALAQATLAPEAIDRVFLTGGASLTPRLRRLFAERFGATRIAGGGELTSIAHGLALIGREADVAAWAA